MTIESLFKKRRKLYYKELLKYLRYIFNDHFSLVLVFLIGAGGFAYSNYLEDLTNGDLQAKFVLLVLYFILSIYVSISLIVEPADKLFLLAKEEDFYPVFKKIIMQSYLQSLILIALIVFISYPVSSVIMAVSRLEGVFIFLTLAGLKWLNLLIKMYPYFHQNKKKYQLINWIIKLFTIVVVALMIFVNIKIIAFLILVLTFFSMYLFLKGEIYFNHSLKWDVMIEAEEARMNRMYRFISVFVDVPTIESRTKRLSFLDYPLERLSKIYPKAAYYYAVRLVTRDSEYHRLILRLTLLASLFLWMIDSYRITVIFSLLFIYLLGFQLISLVPKIKELPQLKLYPVSEQEKVQSVIYLINQILICMGIFMMIVYLISDGWIGVTLLPINILASYLFSYHYIPRRLKLNEL